MDCPACNAKNAEGITCEMHFHTLLNWEWQYDLQEVHHLLVLCYHLQHPRLYSPEALRGALWQLVQFVEGGMSPQQMREEIRRQVANDTRTHKITGTPEHHGSYEIPVPWTMFIGDVVAAGHQAYYASIRAWAESLLAALYRAGILDAS